MKRTPARRDSTLRFYKEGMLRVLRAIQADLDAPPPLERLAALASLSPFHFHRVFHGMLGEPLAAHVRRLRLERAAERLRESSRSVLDVALEAGYDSHEAFSRAFKTAYALTPSQFRRAPEVSTRLRAPCRIHYGERGEIRDFRTINRSVSMQVTIQHLPPLRVAYIRHCGPYAGCGAAWERLCLWMGNEGYLGGGCRFIGVSYDDPDVTPPDQIRYDACITVDAAFVPTGEIAVGTVGGGEYAMTTHFGPYEEFPRTYARLLGQWIPRHGRRIGPGPCLEFYLNSPDDTAPADLLTDVYVPLLPLHA